MAHSVAWMSSPIDARTARLLMLELLLPPVISKEKAKEKCVDTSCRILVKSSQARQGKSNQARRGLPALTTPPCLRGRLRTPGPLDPLRSSSSSSSTGRARALGGVCLGLGEDIVTRSRNLLPKASHYCVRTFKTCMCSLLLRVRALRALSREQNRPPLQTRLESP